MRDCSILWPFEKWFASTSLLLAYIQMEDGVEILLSLKWKIMTISSLHRTRSSGCLKRWRPKVKKDGTKKGKWTRVLCEECGKELKRSVGKSRHIMVVFRQNPAFRRLKQTDQRLCKSHSGRAELRGEWECTDVFVRYAAAGRSQQLSSIPATTQSVLERQRSIYIIQEQILHFQDRFGYSC